MPATTRPSRRRPSGESGSRCGTTPRDSGAYRSAPAPPAASLGLRFGDGVLTSSCGPSLFPALPPGLDLVVGVPRRGDHRWATGELAASLDDPPVEVLDHPSYAVLGRLPVEHGGELGILEAQADRGRGDAGDLLALDELLHPPVRVVLLGQVQRLAGAGEVVELASFHRPAHLQIHPVRLVADPLCGSRAPGALVLRLLLPVATVASFFDDRLLVLWPFRHAHPRSRSLRPLPYDAAGSHHRPRCTTSSNDLRARRAGDPATPTSSTRWPTEIAPIGVHASGTPNASRNAVTRSGGMPKKQAPRPPSTAVCRISNDAMPVSMCQYGTGHRSSSRSAQPLSSSA